MILSDWRRISARPAAALLLTAAVPMTALAETRPTLNFYGVTGLIDMPSAEGQPDGDFSINVSRFGPTTRTTLTFQISPRLQGSFRYTGVRGLTLGGFGPNDTYYDRSFDIRYRLLNEGLWWPSVTIGLQDFIGTGLFSGEYVVATKHVSPRVKVTAGLGWGRLGSYGSFANLGTRPAPGTATGGTPNIKQWFRGPISPFGGIEWQVTDKLGLKFEYSSDAYSEEARKQGLFNRRSPINIGAEYQLTEGVRLGAYYLYGSTIGFSANIALNPKRRAIAGISGPAPAPVVLRPPRQSNPAAWSDSWASAGSTAAATSLGGKVANQLQAEGVVLESLAVTGSHVEVRISNRLYDANAQAIGRTARALTATMPASVETFDIVPVERGMDLARVRVRRSDIESLEHQPHNAAALRQRVEFSDAAAVAPGHVPSPNKQRALRWGVSPYLRYGLFDPSGPVRADVGLRLSGELRLARGLYLSGSVTQRLAGNLSKYNKASNSVLPHVRTDDYLRSRRSNELERLTLAWYARPGANLYSRVTAGYLERGYGGISGELLWKPVDSRLALGAELNYVKQRSFTSATGFANYSIATGHVSAYYALPSGYHVQLDVGRYLAGDLGATLSLDREFANGWRFGAFATLTNVSAARFGEGSFDKGIRLTIPVNWLIGAPVRAAASTTIRPIQRDGGARVDVTGRLYETVRSWHMHRTDDQWGRVWR